MNNHQPFLSVIVPIYGVEDYLSECVLSIINQTYQNLEIILVDDGAKGKEPQICDEFASKYPQIKVLHKKNEGLVAARKTGLKSATSEYVTFIDGDDYIAPDYYEKMMTYVIKENPDLVAVSITEKYSDNTIVKYQKIKSGIYESKTITTLFENMNCADNSFYTYGIWPSTCLKIYKTSQLREMSYDIPNNIRIGEDCAFTFPYILNCKKIVVDNDINGYYYRIIQTSMLHKADKNFVTSASALCDYLQPYYQFAKNPYIFKQFLFFKAYFQFKALGQLTLGISLENINQKINELRETVTNSSLFSQIQQIIKLDIPTELREQLLLIDASQWKKYKRKARKKIIISRLRTTAHKFKTKIQNDVQIKKN